MRIDPREVVLCINERRIVKLALLEFAEKRDRQADAAKRPRTKESKRDDASRAYDLYTRLDEFA